MRLNNSEWKVMQVVWDGPPVAARDVHDALSAETGWAYTTVKTLLERLVEKGALRAAREGRATSYEPVLERGDARRSAVHNLVDQAFGGAVTPLLRFLSTDERLSASERAELSRLLEQAEDDDR